MAAAAAGDDKGVLVHAAAAVAQYKGDLLPGLYDDWLLDARSALERQCTGLWDLLCATRARTGDLTGAVDAARRRIQLQPLEEAGYRTLMLLQADLGDRAGAVSTYHHCASVLERELGVVPDPATRRAFQRLMASGEVASGEQARGSARRHPLRLRRRAARRPVAGVRPASRPLAGPPRPAVQLAVIRGGAGVGKTRIAIEIAGIARLHGAVVAGSQCFGTSGGLALAPVADWLRSPAVQAAAAALDPAWRAEVGRLVPSEEREEREAGSRAMADAWQRHRFYEGLARALIAVGRPLLLVLDNMQWCDQETLAFITFFLGLASGAPVLVAATVRDDGPDNDPELADWTVRMRATRLLTELSLSPLEAAGTARLAEVISGRPLPEDDANLLHATTGGFPLYVIEAVRGSVDLGGAEPRRAGPGDAGPGGAPAGR